MATLPKPGDDPELDGETRIPILLGVSIASILVSSVIVLLRLLTRFYIVRSLGSDDYTIVFAQVLCIGVSATTILQAKYGLGRHVWLVGQEATMKQMQSLFAGEIIYNLTQMVTKVLYLMTFLVAWAVVQEVLVGMTCIPTAILYPSQRDVCINSLTPVIKTLQLQRRQKLLVIGFFTCVITVLRLFTLSQAINSEDTTWGNSPTLYWTVVEVNCAIICASVATLRPLLRNVIPGLSHKDEESYSNQRATLNTYSQASRSQHREVPGVFPPQGLTQNGSHEGPEENAAHTAAD